MRCRTWFPDDAVAGQVGSDLLAHRIFPKEASENSDRRYYEVEYDTQNDSRIDPAHDVSQRHPPFVDPRQASGEYEGRNEQQNR